MASVKRLIHIVLVLSWHLGAHFADRQLRRLPWLAVRLNFLEGPQRLRVVFERLGGSFIKFGQMLALQPDMLPPEYCEALYKLLDRIEPVPFSEIERVFVEDTGQTMAQTFDSFECDSIASGSIGQVHVGYLWGRKVAIKVQRPDTQSTFRRDIRLMRLATKCVHLLGSTILDWMIDPFTEFAAWTEEELDFRTEARYMRQMRKNGRENPNEHVPAVAPKLVTPRVLVIEFLDGVCLLDYIRQRESPEPVFRQQLEEFRFDGDTVARNIIDNFLGDAFQHGLFHADLHPANLLILKNSVVGYIDFGITGVLSQYSREKLVAMTLAFARKDIAGMCDRFFEVSSIESDSDPQAFRQSLQRISDGWYVAGDSGGVRFKTTTTLVMLDMLRLSRRTAILPQRDVIKYIRSCIAIDGLIRQFAPDFDVSDHLAKTSRRYLADHARQALLSHNTLVDWTSANVHLLRDGALRAAGALEQFVAQDSTGSRQPKPGDRSGQSRQRDSQIALTAFVAMFLILLLISTSDGVHWGANLFTAQMMIIAGVAWHLLRLMTRPLEFA